MGINKTKNLSVGMGTLVLLTFLFKAVPSVALEEVDGIKLDRKELKNFQNTLIDQQMVGDVDENIADEVQKRIEELSRDLKNKMKEHQAADALATGLEQSENFDSKTQHLTQRTKEERLQADIDRISAEMSALELIGSEGSTASSKKTLRKEIQQEKDAYRTPEKAAEKAHNTIYPSDEWKHKRRMSRNIQKLGEDRAGNIARAYLKCLKTQYKTVSSTYSYDDAKSACDQEKAENILAKTKAIPEPKKEEVLSTSTFNSNAKGAKNNFPAGTADAANNGITLETHCRVNINYSALCPSILSFANRQKGLGNFNLTPTYSALSAPQAPIQSEAACQDEALKEVMKAINGANPSIVSDLFSVATLKMAAAMDPNQKVLDHRAAKEWVIDKNSSDQTNATKKKLHDLYVKYQLPMDLQSPEVLSFIQCNRLKKGDQRCEIPLTNLNASAVLLLMKKDPKDPGYDADLNPDEYDATAVWIYEKIREAKAKTDATYAVDPANPNANGSMMDFATQVKIAKDAYTKNALLSQESKINKTFTDAVASLTDKQKNCLKCADTIAGDTDMVKMLKGKLLEYATNEKSSAAVGTHLDLQPDLAKDGHTLQVGMNLKEVTAVPLIESDKKELKRTPAEAPPPVDEKTATLQKPSTKALSSHPKVPYQAITNATGGTMPIEAKTPALAAKEILARCNTGTKTLSIGFCNFVASSINNVCQLKGVGLLSNFSLTDPDEATLTRMTENCLKKDSTPAANQPMAANQELIDRAIRAGDSGYLKALEDGQYQLGQCKIEKSTATSTYDLGYGETKTLTTTTCVVTYPSDKGHWQYGMQKIHYAATDDKSISASDEKKGIFNLVGAWGHIQKNCSLPAATPE